MKYLLPLLCISLVACSSKPSPEQNQGRRLQEHFSTQTRDDGAKEFSLAISVNGDRAKRKSQGGDKASGKTRGNRSQDGRAAKAQAMLDRLEQRLDTLLSENQYCETGYEITERTLSAGQASIRGECKESADSGLAGDGAA